MTVLFQPSNNRKTQLSRGRAMEGTSPPPDSVAHHTSVPNGEVCNGQLSSGAVGGSVDRHGKLNGQSHEAKDLLAIHAVSNVSIYIYSYVAQTLFVSM